MYIPSKFLLDEDAAWRVVRDAGAGALIVTTSHGLASVFVPVIVSEDRKIISSHLAKANPWWRSVQTGDDILGLFLAASAYVTPSYYPSRIDDPRVVPTWNYHAAEVRGTVTLHQEPSWKLEQVRALTKHFEAGRDREWRVDEAPDSYIDQQLKAIVGIEINVSSIEGKAKLSQNRPMIDRDTVRDEFAKGTLGERNVAQRMSSDG